MSRKVMRPALSVLHHATNSLPGTLKDHELVRVSIDLKSKNLEPNTAVLIEKRADRSSLVLSMDITNQSALMSVYGTVKDLRTRNMISRLCGMTGHSLCDDPHQLYSTSERKTFNRLAKSTDYQHAMNMLSLPLRPRVKVPGMILVDSNHILVDGEALLHLNEDDCAPIYPEDDSYYKYDRSMDRYMDIE